LDRLAAWDPEKPEFVKRRCFVGLSLEETASALGVSLTTAKRWWQYARAWLKVEMWRNGTSGTFFHLSGPFESEAAHDLLDTRTHPAKNPFLMEAAEFALERSEILAEGDVGGAGPSSCRLREQPSGKDGSQWAQSRRSIQVCTIEEVGPSQRKTDT